MRVQMVTTRWWQDGGVERPLAAGQAYDVPDAVGAALVATGAARRVTVQTSAPARGRNLAAPETKPVVVPEEKA